MPIRRRGPRHPPVAMPVGTPVPMSAPKTAAPERPALAAVAPCTAPAPRAADGPAAREPRRPAAPVADAAAYLGNVQRTVIDDLQSATRSVPPANSSPSPGRISRTPKTRASTLPAPQDLLGAGTGGHRGRARGPVERGTGAGERREPPRRGQPATALSRRAGPAGQDPPRSVRTAALERPTAEAAPCAAPAPIAPSTAAPGRSPDPSQRRIRPPPSPSTTRLRSPYCSTTGYIAEPAPRGARRGLGRV